MPHADSAVRDQPVTGPRIQFGIGTLLRTIGVAGVCLGACRADFEFGLVLTACMLVAWLRTVVVLRRLFPGAQAVGAPDFALVAVESLCLTVVIPVVSGMVAVIAGAIAFVPIILVVFLLGGGERELLGPWSAIPYAAGLNAGLVFLIYLFRATTPARS